MRLLYHLSLSPFCRKVRIALAEKALPFELKTENTAERREEFLRLNPACEVPVLVDPIVGDNGRLYVADATAAAIRDELLPLATIATPNLFELQWLTGAAGNPIEAAGRLGPQAVVVTSAAETRDAISTLLVAGPALVERSLVRRHGIPNGAGDLLAGLFLGHLLDDQGLADALHDCCAHDRPPLDVGPPYYGEVPRVNPWGSRTPDVGGRVLPADRLELATSRLGQGEQGEAAEEDRE